MKTKEENLRINCKSPLLRRFFADTSGANGIEYALIVSGVALAILVSVGFVGSEVVGAFERVNTVVADARPST
ncbi:MAG: Flp family type IVb pilin [Magnetospiraceae bacterium]